MFRTQSTKSLRDAEPPPKDDNGDEEHSAKEFLLKTAARSLDSALKGKFLCLLYVVKLLAKMELSHSCSAGCRGSGGQEEVQEGLEEGS